jgi:hypothetical protein
MIENKEITISFDFDGTLSLPSVQELAIKLIKEGYNVIVITTRHSKYLNQDLVKVTEKVGINKIVYTDGDKKMHYMEDVDIHFDNDETELREISRSTYTEVINVTDNQWKAIAQSLLQ